AALPAAPSRARRRRNRPRRGAGSRARARSARTPSPAATRRSPARAGRRRRSACAVASTCSAPKRMAARRCRARAMTIWSAAPRQAASRCSMNGTVISSDLRRRVIRLWLCAVAAVIFALVVVGGATRLTGSGLSIVEWRPVTRILPPLTEDGWQADFAKYRMIPQYKQVNRGMSLAEFKTIYWWEWTHRMLGRLVGVVFLFPFLWFLWRGWIDNGLRSRLWGIFALGTLQVVV